MQTKKYDRTTLYILLALIGISIYSTIPYLNMYLPNSQDLPFHLARIEGIYRSCLNGDFLARINPIQAAGYGYASGVMYPQFFLYIPATLRLFGISLVNSYKLFMLLINFATAGIAYFSIREITRSRSCALIGSSLYVMSLYRLMDIYTRGALGEVLGMTFLPLVIYGIYEILVGNCHKWIYLTIGYSCILQSHILSTLMTTFFCVLAVIPCAPRLLRERKRILSLIYAACLTLLLNLWFILPFLSYYTQDFNIKNNSSNNLYLTAVSFSQMFTNHLDTLLGFSTDITTTKGEMIESLGLILIFTTVLYVVKPQSEKGTTHTKAQKQTYLVLLLFGLLSIWMSSILFPWKVFNFIAATIQFAWRFLSYATVFLCIIGAIGINQWIHAYAIKSTNQMHFLILLSVFVIMASSQFYLDYTTQLDELPEVIQDQQQVEGRCSDELYLYRTHSIPDLQTRPREYIVTDSYVEVPTYYYPGYKAWINKKEVPVQQGSNGVIQIPINGSFNPHELEIQFVEPVLWKCGNIISLITIVLCTLYYFKRKRAC